MGANIPQNGGSEEDLAPLAEINVTPLVDVMLVLLIIFMVAAPLMVSGVPVKLPESTTAQDRPPAKPMVVTIAADGQLYIRDEQVSREELIPRLAALRPSEGQPETTAYVRADKTIAYGRVMEVLNDVSQAGYSRISLLSHLKSQ
ncbi:MAG: biopolymer transporter ExbD [Hyphomicrobiales bacterium]|nr:biopolymer transporter ExbD [Hyphomicrobiales bacterium]